MQIEFDTYAYSVSHGTQPKGRGSWAFGTRRNPDVTNDAECWFSPSMTFTEAKKWAKAEAKRRFPDAKSGTLYVLS